jgi:hypothetical protein
MISSTWYAELLWCASAEVAAIEKATPADVADATMIVMRACMARTSSRNAIVIVSQKFRQTSISGSHSSRTLPPASIAIRLLGNVTQWCTDIVGCTDTGQ